MNLFVVMTALYLAVVSMSLVIASPETILDLGNEDGFFEYLTALYFLLASIFFFLAYRKTKPPGKQWPVKAAHLFLMILSIAFFFASGEEMSWGQRVFRFRPPKYFIEKNIQQELNIHNLEALNLTDRNHHLKGLAKRYLTTIAGLFSLFSMVYGVLIPFLYRYLPLFRRGLQDIHLAVAPVEIGVFFILNVLFFRALTALRSPLQNQALSASLGEIKESHVAFIFMMIALYFLKRPSESNLLEKDKVSLRAR